MLVAKQELLTVDMNLLDKQIKKLSKAEVDDGLLELVISIYEQLEENDFAVIRKV